MRRCLVALAVLPLVLPAFRAAAHPVNYEFSGVYLSVYDEVGYSRPDLLRRFEPCLAAATCRTFSGSFSYDSDTELLQLNFHSPEFVGIDFSGAARLDTPDTDVVNVGIQHPALGWFAEDGQTYKDGGWIGLTLTAAGLISDGQLRSGLGVSDFGFAFLFSTLLIDVVGGDTCHELTRVECHEQGLAHNADMWTTDYEITELHQVPEGSGPSVLALILSAVIPIWKRRRLARRE